MPYIFRINQLSILCVLFTSYSTFPLLTLGFTLIRYCSFWTFIHSLWLKLSRSDTNTLTVSHFLYIAFFLSVLTTLCIYIPHLCFFLILLLYDYKPHSQRLPHISTSLSSGFLLILSFFSFSLHQYVCMTYTILCVF